MSNDLGLNSNFSERALGDLGTFCYLAQVVLAPAQR
jgi:hypothetical protein